MPYLPQVVRADHKGGFRIRLAFSDGLEATLGVDGSPTVADLSFDHDGDGTAEFRTVLTVPMGTLSK